MASWDHQLLSAVIRDENPGKKFEEAQRCGINFKSFGPMEVQVVWSRIKTHYERNNNYGHVPSEQTINEWFPSLELPNAVENFPDLCQKVVDNYTRRRLDKFLTEAIQDMHDKPHEVASTLLENIGKLQEMNSKSNDRSFSENALEEELDSYNQRKENDGCLGLPYPWAQMNADTRGMAAGDYIMIWAMPKSMKTWLGLICTAHLVKTGRRCLIYSKEMMWPTIRQRMCAILAGVNYERLLDGKLSAGEEKMYFDTIRELTSAEHRGEFIFTDADQADGSVGGPADIRRKIDVYKPDFVFLDSSYMLQLPGVGGDRVLDWKVLSVINREVKQIAKTTAIPIMAIFQENETQAIKHKKSRGTASLSMNKGAVMDCDLGIRLVHNKLKNELTIRYAVGREVMAEGFSIHAIACENFDYAGRHLWDIGDDYEGDDKDDAPDIKDPPKKDGGITSGRAGFGHTPDAADVTHLRVVDETEVDAPSVSNA